MANKVFIDNILDPATGDQGFFLGMNTDNGYPGMDLSLKFAEEIKGYTSVWKWIQARIKAGNFYGIHVGDYIPFNCTNSAKTRIVAVVAGIDTYYKYGDQQVGHHIDFISKDLWPTYIQYNLANFNNGLIPVEKLSGDGSKTEFVLTKQMDGIDNIIVGSDQVTGYTYDASTFTVTFDEAPAAGTRPGRTPERHRRKTSRASREVFAHTNINNTNNAMAKYCFSLFPLQRSDEIPDRAIAKIRYFARPVWRPTSLFSFLRPHFVLNFKIMHYICTRIP